MVPKSWSAAECPYSSAEHFTSFKSCNPDIVMKIATILLTGLLLTQSVHSESVGGKDDALAVAITASNWSWENTDGGKRSVEDIQFYKGGFAQNPRFFTARWEITASRTVILRNTTRGNPQNGKLAYLVFDAALTHFVGFDFNGKTTVEGFRREALDPNRPAPEENPELK
jgi:hypothetical protein